MLYSRMPFPLSNISRTITGFVRPQEGRRSRVKPPPALPPARGTLRPSSTSRPSPHRSSRLSKGTASSCCRSWTTTGSRARSMGGYVQQVSFGLSLWIWAPMLTSGFLDHPLRFWRLARRMQYAVFRQYRMFSLYVQDFYFRNVWSKSNPTPLYSWPISHAFYSAPTG